MRHLLTAAFVVGVSAWGGVPTSALGTDETTAVDELLSSLQGRYRNIQTLEARFTQVKVSAFGELTSEGTVAVAKPRKARWETKGEQGSIFVTDGVKMSIYTPASNQVIQMDEVGGTSSGNVDIMALLQDISKLDEQFEIALKSDDPAATERFVVDAKPRKPGGYSNVRIEFDRTSLDLVRVVFTESMGGTTELRFTQLKVDGSINDATFEFTPPAGVTIIDGSAM
jgi:outer membrane lipoprotein carrier protein